MTNRYLRWGYALTLGSAVALALVLLTLYGPSYGLALWVALVAVVWGLSVIHC